MTVQGLALCFPVQPRLPFTALGRGWGRIQPALCSEMAIAWLMLLFQSFSLEAVSARLCCWQCLLAQMRLVLYSHGGTFCQHASFKWGEIITSVMIVA